MRRVRSSVLLVFSVLGIGAGTSAAYDWFWGPQSHWRAAQKAVNRHDFVHADKHLTLYLAAKPDDAEAHLLAARIARRAIQPRLDEHDDDRDDTAPARDLPAVGSYDTAEKHLKEYKRFGGPPELIKLERLLAHAQRGDMAQIEGPLWGWVEKDHPDTVLILEALAKGYVVTYRLREAEQCLDLLLEREESPQALVLRGWLAVLRQNFDRAIELYGKVLQLEPENEEVELQLATTLRSCSKPQDALGHYQHLRQRRPDDRTVTFGLADTQLTLGQTDEARQLLDPWLAEDPDNAQALLLRARIELKDRRPAAAEASVRKILSKNAWDRQANLLLCECLGHDGNKGEIAEIQARLDSIEAEIYRLDDVTHAIITTPNDATLRWEAGAAMICRGHPKTAFRWLRSALAIDPQHQPTRRLLEDYQRYGEKPGSALYRNAHSALADHYKKLPDPKMKPLVAYHDQAVRLAVQAEQPITRAK